MGCSWWLRHDSEEFPDPWCNFHLGLLLPPRSKLDPFSNSFLFWCLYHPLAGCHRGTQGRFPSTEWGSISQSLPGWDGEACRASEGEHLTWSFLCSWRAQTVSRSQEEGGAGLWACAQERSEGEEWGISNREMGHRVARYYPSSLYLNCSWEEGWVCLPRHFQIWKFRVNNSYVFI